MTSEDDAIWHVLINGAQRGPLLVLPDRRTGTK
jgi:hypothetical protein